MSESLKLSNYDMTFPKLGLAVIFYVDDFGDGEGFEEKAFEKDAKDLHDILKRIGFTVEMYKNRTRIEALLILNEIAKKPVDEDIQDNFKDHCCFIAAFISHGYENHVIMKEEELNIEDDVLKGFRGDKCKALLNKPKIFLFSTCQGNEREKGVLSKSTPMGRLVKRQTRWNGKPLSTYTPAGSDFLVCYSSEKHTMSFYDENNGSWFIQTLVKLLDIQTKENDEEELDFASVITLVTDEISDYIALDDKTLEDCFQIPQTVTSLRKRIIFPKRFLKPVEPSGDVLPPPTPKKQRCSKEIEINKN